MEPTKNHEQPRVTEGEQKVILDPAVTGETDELDPEFNTDDSEKKPPFSQPKPGDDPSSEII